MGTRRPVNEGNDRTIHAARVTVDELIEGAVERAIERLLGPYLVRLQEPEPLVYTVSEAATVLHVSNDTIGRLVKRGVLDKLPHLDGKTLIPRRSVDELVAGASPERSDAEPPEVTQLSERRPRRRASGP